MRKLGVTLLGVITLFLMVVLIGPVFVGVMVQKNYTALLKSYQDHTPQVHFTLANYQRHWFSSDATVKVTIQPSPNVLMAPTTKQAPATTLTLQQHISHGPVIFTQHNGQNKLLFAKAIMTQKVLHQDWASDSRTVWQFNNTLHTTLRLKKGVLHEKTYSVVASDVRGEVEHDIDTHHFSGDIVFGHFVIQPHGPHQKLKNIAFDHFTIKADLQTDKALWFGTRRAWADKVTMQIGEQQLAMNNLLLSLAISHSADSRTTNFDVHYRVDSLTTQKGPAGSFNLEFSCNDMDTQALQELKRKMNALEAEGALGIAAIPALKNPFEELLKKGLALKVNALSVKFGGNSASLDANIVLPPAKENVTSHLPYLATVIHQLSGAGNVSVTQGWVNAALMHHYASVDRHYKRLGRPVSQESVGERSAHSLNHLIENHMLIEKGDQQLDLSWALKSGALTINGRAPNLGLDDRSSHAAPALPSKPAKVPQQMMVPQPHNEPATETPKVAPKAPETKTTKATQPRS